MEREKRLVQTQNDNKRLGDQIAILHSPVMLDRRAKELCLGLVPAQPLQVVRIAEMLVTQEKNSSRQFAQRLAIQQTP